MASTTDHSLVSVKIMVDGSPIKEEYDIYEVNVSKVANKIASARIRLIDGSVAKEDFKLSDGEEFVPGKDIEIQAGFGLKTKRIFKGIIISQSLRAKADLGPSLLIECKDEAVKMTIGAKNGIFTDKTDSDVITQLIGDHNLSAQVSSTTNTYAQIVQYYATDWDFLLTRVEANGMIVITGDGKVEVVPPKVDASPDLTLTFGTDIFEVDTVVDARTQFAGVEAQSWDFKTQSVVQSSASSPSGPDQGNLSADKLAKVAGPDTVVLQTTAPLDSGALKTWADSSLLRSRMAKIEGTLKIFGNADLAPNSVVELKGIGKRFNGNAYISGVRHEINEGNWWTFLSIGLSPDWFASIIEVTARPASALLPGIRGLQNGIVKKIDEDPDGETRVQVEVPMFKSDSGNGLIWARWVQGYATTSAGYFFMPELEDEVILGFLNEDPRFPVILGSLYSSQRAPAYQPTAENPIKAIVTKKQLVIEFDDQNKVLTIKTPGANQIQLTDQDQGIVIQDQNSNKITLNTDGISIQSPSNIEIKAGGEMKISAEGGVTVSSPSQVKVDGGMEVSVSGQNASLEGSISLSAEGGTTSIQASGPLALKGSLVTIN
ncbi:type VI secretion system tip protein VgrG [Flavilitoribacter nigricans]|uniref:Gp5/Type VI secretion system Vgr protein OB-fold domain-containing protein n=1 Tax=Flavilitoribacter nigricans (strain ATCC 23147 / DSM 23189 / NBRC 102662 / NCIMB 1420 / SS-2) TaxID=1122177 RepID=A0A2D0N1B1_FLAN2|nr:type VI secretion system tip protein VgrG [Flavilitoribacter nigricans]PHN02220.1 hypothetical protein CRP01_33335 [Flavilitoribacter nigricans DSM 23189 = NBRC 102662]